MGDSITNNTYTYLDFNHINYFQDKELVIYKNIKNEIKTVYLLDNYIQIEPYQRMNLHLRLEERVTPMLEK